MSSQLTQAYNLVQEGKHGEAIALLRAMIPTGEQYAGWLKQLGWALVQNGEYDEGIQNLRESIVMADPLEAAITRIDLSAALQRVGETLEAIEVLRDALPPLQQRGQTYFYTWALLNLGAFELNRWALDSATYYLEEAQAWIRASKAAAPLRGRGLNIRSELARAHGDYESALYRAALALTLDLSMSISDRLISQRMISHAHRMSGAFAAATKELIQARFDAAQQGADQTSIEADLVITDFLAGNHRRSQERIDGLDWERLPAQDQARVLLYRAELSRRSKDIASCARYVQDALALEQALPIHEEGRFLPDLYAWGRSSGLDLPSEVIEPAPRRVRLEVIGEPKIWVFGQRIPTHGGGRAIPLLAYLLIEGETDWYTLGQAIYPDGKQAEKTLYANVTMSIARLREILGRKTAVILSRKKVRLAKDILWECDFMELVQQPASSIKVDGAFLDGQYPSLWSDQKNHVLLDFKTLN